MRSAALIVLLLLFGFVEAGDLRQPAPGVHALVDVRIVTRPGQVIESGTIVIRDGLLEAVGADVDVPADARVHEFPREDGQDPITVYPGLIEPYLMVEPARNDEDETTPEGRHALINPDRRLRARDWPEGRAEELRRAGFTTALLAPASGLLRGSGVVANLGDGGLQRNLLIDAFGQFASFSARADGGTFPTSLMGAVALMRQTFDDARWQQQARAAWQGNPAQARPEWLEGLDALVPALNGTMPLIFDAEDPLDTLRILEFIDAGDIDLILVGHGAEYQRLSALEDRRVRHILPLSFPDPPEVKTADDRNVSIEALRHWHAAADNPRILQEAQIPMMFTTEGLSQPGQIFSHLARAIERGLDPDRALAAMTTEPAQWLGLSSSAGQISTGAMANLLIVEGELMTENPAITEVWVDGRRFALAAMDPPTIDPAGTWDLVLGLGGMGDVEASLVLSGPPTRMVGTLTVMGNETELNDVRVSGERVIATIDASRFGGSGSISLRVDIDGDRARGSGSGPFGEFTVRGRRTGTPDDEETR